MKQITVKRLSLMAMLIALQIILSKFLMLQVTSSVRLSIDSVPILLSGIWFGPLAGGIVGLLSDLLGTLLFPTAGLYYPPLTVAFVLIGVSAGLFVRLVKSERALVRAALIVIPSEIIGSLLAKSAALSLLIALPFPAMLAARLLPVGSIMIIDTLLIFALDRLLGEKVRVMDASSSKSTSNLTLVEDEASITYDEALEYIHHVTWRGSRLGLERTRELLERIGNPQSNLKFIHVAGTNGKGSTCAMLAQTLSLAGYVAGLYISPYINRFNERMQINGEPIENEELAQITQFVRPHAEAMADHPTEFELITAIAFEYFYRHGAEIVVLEVGMGGALDSTNVIDTPELAIITNIGLDHTRELGPTIADIARAKAGIIKPGGDVLIYGQSLEADAVFESVCREQGAILHRTNHERISNVSISLDALSFTCEPYGSLTCGLVGVYQVKNATVAITAVELLRNKGWRISDQILRNGLSSVRWPARFEVLRRDPIFIADGGHNPQGVAAVAESLKAHFPGRTVTFLLGVMADKDVSNMIEQIGPIANGFVTVTPDNPRAMSAIDLADLLRRQGFAATAGESVQVGVRLAIERAGSDGIVCALGSLYMLGDVRVALGVKQLVFDSFHRRTAMSFRDQTIDVFLSKLSSKAPIPGGGGASALVAALCCSLASMVAALTVNKPKYAAVEAEMESLQIRLKALQERFLALMDEDAAAFEPLAQAYRLPKNTDEEKAEKMCVMEAALKSAVMPPLQIMEYCAETFALIARCAEKGSVVAVSDAGVAASFCRAALEGASLNVFINTQGMQDRSYAETLNSRARQLLAQYGESADELVRSIVARLCS